MSASPNNVWKQWVWPSLDLAARWYLGAIFIFAAVGKIADPYSFAVSIASYQIIPNALVNLMAIILPWFEIVVGALLVLGIQSRAQALAINGMMVMFTAAIIMALSKDLQMQCGCFASEEAAADISIMTVWRDLAWLAIGVFIYVANASKFGVDGLWQRWQNKKWEGIDE